MVTYSLRLLVFMVFVLILLASFAFSSQQLRAIEQREKILTPKVFRNSRGETLPYRLFTPPHYDQKRKYPLVVYLHGGGGRGSDNRQQIDGGNGYLIDFFTGHIIWPSVVKERELLPWLFAQRNN